MQTVHKTSNLHWIVDKFQSYINYANISFLIKLSSLLILYIDTPLKCILILWWALLLLVPALEGEDFDLTNSFV